MATEIPSPEQATAPPLDSLPWRLARWAAGLATRNATTVVLLAVVGYMAWLHLGPQAPENPIVGPAWVAPGRTAILDIPDVHGDPQVIVVPTPTQFAVRQSGDGKFLLFTADVPGLYTIVYADTGGWFSRRTLLAQHAIQVSDTPPEPGPEPGPTPPVPPLDGYAAKAFEFAKQVTADPTKGASARLLAANFRAVASQAAAGGYQDAATILGDLKNRNAASLGAKRDAWLPFFLALSSQLAADGFGTQGAKQPAEYAVVLEQAGRGLEAVR